MIKKEERYYILDILYHTVHWYYILYILNCTVHSVA
jgi:hypothetical protein